MSPVIRGPVTLAPQLQSCHKSFLLRDKQICSLCWNRPSGHCSLLISDFVAAKELLPISRTREGQAAYQQVWVPLTTNKAFPM